MADVSRAQIVAEARSWLGVKWRHQGRTRCGVDCAGLVVNVAHALELSEFDTRDYARQAADETLLDICREHLIPVRLADLAPGDVLVTAWENQRHIGIVGVHPVSGLTMIHAYAPSRAVVEMRLDARMMDRAVGAFRFQGVV
jgi:NlpC/P60 family putative phage cell wall peptidase